MADVRNESDPIRIGDLQVHRMGYGAMRLTGEGIWGPPRDREAAHRVLRRALEIGIDLIDTADAYGPDVNEELIAEALHPYPANLVIATKGGLVRPGPGEWRPDGRPEHLREALHGSLRRLKLDAIDLYQFHRPDPDVPFEDSIGAIKDMKDAGLIRNVGLSNVSVEQLEAARGIVEIASVQNRFNLADQESRGVLDRCDELGIAFLPWYPINMGDLEGEVERIASDRGATPAQVALAWLLQLSPVVTPIPGTSSVAHLEENVAATSLGLSEEEMEALTA